MINECVKDWNSTSIDVDGHSGGGIMTWSPDLKLISITQFGSVLATLLEYGET